MPDQRHSRQHYQQQEQEEVPQRPSVSARDSSKGAEVTPREEVNSSNRRASGHEIEREVREEFAHSASAERRGSNGLARNRIALFESGAAATATSADAAEVNVYEGRRSVNQAQEEEDSARRDEFLNSSLAERRGSSGLAKNRIAMFSASAAASDECASPVKEGGGASVRAMSPARVSIHAGEGIDNSSKLSLKERIAMFNKEREDQQ